MFTRWGEGEGGGKKNFEKTLALGVFTTIFSSTSYKSTKRTRNNDKQ